MVRIAGLVQDITERQVAQEKLRLAAGVFSNALEGIMITAPDGTIVDVQGPCTGWKLTQCKRWHEWNRCLPHKVGASVLTQRFLHRSGC